MLVQSGSERCSKTRKKDQEVLNVHCPKLITCMVEIEIGRDSEIVFVITCSKRST